MTYSKITATAKEKSEYVVCPKIVLPYSTRAAKAKRHKNKFLYKLIALVCISITIFVLSPSEKHNDTVSEISPDLPIEFPVSNMVISTVAPVDAEVDIISEEYKSERGISAYPVIEKDMSYGLPYTSINNETNINIDMEKLTTEIQQAFSDSVKKSSVNNSAPLVLIYHTHGTESYFNQVSNFYEESVETRSVNTSENVVSVGKVLKQTLENFSIPVIHCETMHDIDSYNDSYSNSYASVKEYLKKYPSIKYVIDLHRDAVIGNSNEMYKTSAQIGESNCAQIMFVIGSNERNKNHTGWQNNLTTALKIQKAIKDTYPTLARPINLKKATYNQQLCENSFILEVGTAANTLNEAEEAVKYFGACFAKCILKGNI